MEKVIKRPSVGTLAVSILLFLMIIIGATGWGSSSGRTPSRLPWSHPLSVESSVFCQQHRMTRSWWGGFLLCVFRASGTVYTAIDIATGQEVGSIPSALPAYSQAPPSQRECHMLVKREDSVLSFLRQSLRWLPVSYAAYLNGLKISSPQQESNYCLKYNLTGYRNYLKWSQILVLK